MSEENQPPPQPPEPPERTIEPRREGPPPPDCCAMIVCDAIWNDPWTGKRTLLGIFSVLHAVTFPARHPIMAVYCVLTNGRGKVKLRVRLVDVDDEREPLFEMENEVEFPDPRAMIEFQTAAVNIMFPEPGEYRVQLFAGNEMLAERRILLAALQENP